MDFVDWVEGQEVAFLWIGFDHSLLITCAVFSAEHQLLPNFWNWASVWKKLGMSSCSPSSIKVDNRSGFSNSNCILAHGTSWIYSWVLCSSFADNNCFVVVGFCSSPKIVVVYNPLGWTREEYIRFPVRNLVWLSISLHFLLATWRQLSAAFSQNFLYWLQLQKWVPFYTGMLTSACFHFVSVKVLRGMVEMGNRFQVLHWRSLMGWEIRSHLRLSLFQSQHTDYANCM